MGIERKHAVAYSVKAGTTQQRVMPAYFSVIIFLTLIAGSSFFVVVVVEVQRKALTDAVQVKTPTAPAVNPDSVESQDLNPGSRKDLTSTDREETSVTERVIESNNAKWGGTAKGHDERPVAIDMNLEKYEGLLTFDDGPHPSTTPSLVQTLVNARVRDAVFFFVGYRMIEYPELVSSVIDAGFRVGYHSMFHQNMVNLTAEEIRQDIRHFEMVINEVLGYRYELVLGRPPFGGMSVDAAIDFHQLEEAGHLDTMILDEIMLRRFISASIVEAFEAENLELMLWNVDFDDWEQEVDVDHAIASHTPGSRQIWLLHERPVDWRVFRMFENRVAEHMPQLLSTLEMREAYARRHSEHIRRVQRSLIDLGYEPGPVDGLAGEMTRTAVIQYQKAKGVTVDGKISAELAVALENEAATHSHRRKRGSDIIGSERNQVH